MASTTVQSIILLTGAEEAEALGQHLKTYNPTLHTVTASDKAALDQACASIESGTRLISFCSSVIVPGAYLSAMPCGSYNFHPGPPNYPGRYPSVFALYEQARNFGVTFHEMAARVDEGPIIAAEWFAVPESCDLETLDTMAFKALLAVFMRFAKHIATDPTPFKPQRISWSGTKRAKSDCDALCRIDPTMSAEEKALRTRACGIHLKPAS